MIHRVTGDRFGFQKASTDIFTENHRDKRGEREEIFMAIAAASMEVGILIIIAYFYTTRERLRDDGPLMLFRDVQRENRSWRASSEAPGHRKATHPSRSLVANGMRPPWHDIK